MGIDPKLVVGVAAINDHDRGRLIEALKKANFTPPNGAALEDFVRLAPKIRASSVDSQGRLAFGGPQRAPDEVCRNIFATR